MTDETPADSASADDAAVDDTQRDDTQPEDTQPDDTQPEDTKSDDASDDTHGRSHEISVDGQNYVLRQDSDAWHLGVRGTSGGIRWLPETVAPDTFSLDDDTAMRGVITALIDRGA
jgi:hypothetical protein